MRLCHLAVLTTAVALTASAAGPAPAPARAIDPANFDPAAAPCVDFYQHANGSWLKANPIPEDKGRWGSFEEVAERNRAILKEILTETSAKTDWPKGSIRQKVGDFYAAGMDEAAIEKAGTKSLAPWLAKIDALTSTADLPKLLAEFHARRLPAGFGLNVAQDQKESTRYIPVLGQGGLGLPDRDYYLKEDTKSKELRKKYYEHVAKMFELTGDPSDAAMAKADVVLAFETKLAKASRTRVEMRDPQKNYNKRSPADLAKEAPGFDWKAYLTAVGIPDGQDLNVRQPGFFTAYAGMAASEPVSTWKTYLTWHLLHSAANLLPKRFEEENFDFYGRTLRGVPRQEERWKRVLGATDQALGEALGQLYVDKAFSPKSKERMKVLIENLRAALKDRIEALPWMGAETKKAALKKLAAFGVKIGYPDKWRDYSSLEITRESYFDNVLRAHAFETKRNMSKLGKPIDRTEWGMTPPTVNAYYSPTMNEIVFPAGILQPPFFFPHADDAVNYGGIGGVIGHEMSHGFDDSGSQYDADGNLKNWWSGEDRKAYDSRTALMVKQFDGYKPLADQSINGKLTLGENIGDLGGLKIAYAALAKALGTDPTKAPPVDGFTPAQRFFLNWATVWRNQIRDDTLRVNLNTDPHSPGRFRVLGPLSNLPEFQAAFGCGTGTAMNRPEAERPSIW